MPFTAGAVLDNPDVIAPQLSVTVREQQVHWGWLVVKYLLNLSTMGLSFHPTSMKDPQPNLRAKQILEELAPLSWRSWLETNLFANVTAISDHEAAHVLFAEKLDEAIEEIKKVQAEARKGSAEETTQPSIPLSDCSYS